MCRRFGSQQHNLSPALCQHFQDAHAQIGCLQSSDTCMSDDLVREHLETARHHISRAWDILSRRLDPPASA